MGSLQTGHNIDNILNIDPVLPLLTVGFAEELDQPLGGALRKLEFFIGCIVIAFVLGFAREWQGLKVESVEADPE